MGLGGSPAFDRFFVVYFGTAVRHFKDDGTDGAMLCLFVCKNSKVVSARFGMIFVHVLRWSSMRVNRLPTGGGVV